MKSLPFEAALEYARRGWAVVPVHEPNGGSGCSCGQRVCGSPAKHPRTPRGFLDASIDEDLIHRWWKRWPEANVGIRTGSESGLVVLDVDERHHGIDVLAKLEQEHGRLPATRTASSGGGGLHLYFKHPGVLVRSRSAIAGNHGLDVRGDGGFIVAPPSRHASGGSYRWQDASAALSPMPEWLYDLLASRAAGSTTVADGNPQWPVGAAQGNRNQALFGYASRCAHRGDSLEEIRVLVRHLAATCRPPLTEVERQSRTSCSRGLRASIRRTT